MTWTEAVLVDLECALEVFCSTCGQLWLWGHPQKPTTCQGCGAPTIELGPLGGALLMAKRNAWREAHGTRYTCNQLLDREFETEELVRCGEPEQYRATTNEAAVVHLCADHWRELHPEDQAHYERLETPS